MPESDAVLIHTKLTPDTLTKNSGTLYTHWIDSVISNKKEVNQIYKYVGYTDSKEE